MYSYLSKYKQLKKCIKYNFMRENVHVLSDHFDNKQIYSLYCFLDLRKNLSRIFFLNSIIKNLLSI
jgi:hypothetical protein